MKIIFRADDLGFSEAVNYGIRKAIVDGVITCTGLMPNMPYAAAGYALVKDTGVEVGQHTNICVGRPLTDSARIPSLVQPSGEFCTSREIRAPKTGYHRPGRSGTGDSGAARPLPRHHRAGSRLLRRTRGHVAQLFPGVEECGCP